MFDQADWAKGAAKKFVYVALDFPKAKKITDEEKKYNAAKQAVFAVQGFPTVFVLDSTGRPYARTGYAEGGAEGYLTHLDGFASRKEEIKKARADAAKGTAKEKIEALESLLKKLKEWEVDFGYSDLKEQIVELDADNAAGKRVEYAKQLAFEFRRAGDTEKHKKYFEMLKKLDAAAAEQVTLQLMLDDDVVPLLEKGSWKDALAKLKPILEKKPKGEAGQTAFYYAAVCAVRSDDKDGAIAYLEKAVAAAPDSKRAPQIKQNIEQLKNQ